MPDRRWRLILRRWVSVICCGTVAATAVAAIAPLLRHVCAPGVDRLATLDPILTTLSVAILTGTVCWLAGRGRWLGFVGVRFFFTYPPLWVAVLVGIGGLAAVGANFNGIGLCVSQFQDLQWFLSQLLILAWLPILLILVIVVIVPPLGGVVLKLKKGRESSLQAPEANQENTDAFDALRKWLRANSPIDNTAEDHFKHDAVAQRMATRLAEESDDLPTMALVGPLGSGKSSIGHLLKHHLRNVPKVQLVQVSLWPFDSTEAAVRGILRAITAELGRHVNILPLVGLSEDYVTAIETTAGRFSAISRLLRGSSDPEEILQRFSDIACAAGLRFVLWIEDLERFSGSGQLEGEPQIQRDVERLGAIRALLHLLDQCAAISVVVADTSLRTRFDIGKIARFVERIPPMELEAVWRDVELLRTRCLNDYPRATIDPTSQERRKPFEPEQGASQYKRWLLEAMGDGPYSDFEAVVRVVKTPRALKETLRITLEVWENLPGEVDFDCVLVASCLRVAYPDLFSLIDAHIGLFRYGVRSPGTREEEVVQSHPVYDRVEALLKREEDRVAAAIEKLLVFLFPKYPTSDERRNNVRSKHVGERERIWRPQAMFVDGHTDYWRRYMAQSPVAEEERDQRALEAILQWRDQKPSDLIDRMLDSQRSGRIEQFVDQFTPNDLCRLLSEVSDEVSEQSAAGWRHRPAAPGIDSVWRMMHKKPPSEKDVYGAVKVGLEKYAPIHLPLAETLASLFSCSGPNIVNLMSEVQRQEVGKLLRDALPTHFTGEGAEERLRSALRDGSPWLIRWIVDSQKQGDTQTLPCDRWPDFSNTLLNLAETEPAIGVPLVVGLVSKTESEFGVHLDETGNAAPRRQLVGKFVEEDARRLFPGGYDRLMRVLSEFRQIPRLDQEMQEAYRAAVAAANGAVAADDGG